MNIKLNETTKLLLIYIAGILLLLLVINFFKSKNKKIVDPVTIEKPIFKTTKNSDSSESATVDVIFISNAVLQNSNDSLVKEIRRLKKTKGLKEVTKIERVYVDSSTMKGSDTVFITKNNDTVGAKFYKSESRWLKEYITVYNDTAISEIKIYDEVLFMQRDVRKNFFSKKKSIVEVRSMNPNITTTNLTTYQVIPERKKIWNTRVFNILAGAAASTYLITKIK